MNKEILPDGHGLSESQHHLYTVARFAIDVVSGRHPSPAITDTLSLAEAVRSALMGGYQRLVHRRTFGEAEKPYKELFFSESLSGKDAAGRPLVGHQHAYYLPTDEDGDQRLDHITILAERSFTPDEVQTLDRLRQVKFGDGDPVRLLLIGLGTVSSLQAPLLGPASAWISATPFVVTRYPKLRGRKRDRPEDYASPQQFALCVLQQELQRLRTRRTDMPAIIAVEPLKGLGSQERLRPTEFQRFRQRKRSDDGGRRPNGAFRIVFDRSVRGPFCLGHSCHFGIGLFLPDARE